MGRVHASAVVVVEQVACVVVDHNDAYRAVGEAAANVAVVVDSDAIAVYADIVVEEVHRGGIHRRVAFLDRPQRARLW